LQKHISRYVWSNCNLGLFREFTRREPQMVLTSVRCLCALEHSLVFAASFARLPPPRHRVFRNSYRTLHTSARMSCVHSGLRYCAAVGGLFSFALFAPYRKDITDRRTSFIVSETCDKRKHVFIWKVLCPENVWVKTNIGIIYTRRLHLCEYYTYGKPYKPKTEMKSVP
jgi:hypothetical protein